MSDQNAAALPDQAAGIQAIVELADRAANLHVEMVKVDDLGSGLPPAVPLLLDKRSGSLKSIKPLIEEWRTTPEFRQGQATATTLDSFIELLNRHKRPESVVFAETNWRAPCFRAVIDYHPEAAGEEAGRLKHVIRYAFPLSEEWQAWVKISGQKLEQAEFAAFLEDHIGDVGNPIEFEEGDLGLKFQTTIATASDLMQLARGLQVNVDSAVKSMVTLQSGEAQLLFEETHRGADGKPLKVPGIFVLNIAPFFMGATVRIPVRLRYRVKDGKVIWFMHLHRPDQHVTQRVRLDLDRVRVLTGAPAFEGGAEA